MNKKIVILSLALSVVSIVAAIYAFSNQTKAAFFDYNEVYNDCAMKKQLEGDLQKVVSSRKSELDSMRLELSFLSEAVEKGTASQDEMDKFEDMKERFMTLQGRYEEENVRLKETYFGQIRTHINDKAKLYAEKMGYDFLFSAVGDGALMYGAESHDVTKEFKKYIDK